MARYSIFPITALCSSTCTNRDYSNIIRSESTFNCMIYKYYQKVCNRP